MNKQNLSKYKFIYRVYMNDINEWHIEKYSIIYINQTYVYYKIARKDLLAYCSTCCAYDDLKKLSKHIVECSSLPYRSGEVFFVTFNEDEDKNLVCEIKEFLNSLNANKNNRIKENEKKNKINMAKRAFKEYEMYMKIAMNYGATEEDFK